jgi:hypothetical protein
MREYATVNENNATDETPERSEKNWTMTLSRLEKYVEEQAGMRR